MTSGIRLVTPVPGPRSRAMAARLARAEAPGFTPLVPDPPIFWRAGDGAFIEDVDGNRFLDLAGAFGVAAAGHAAPAVAAAAAVQARLLVAGMGDVEPPEAKVLFLERLLAVAPPGLTRAVLSSDGADAVETALKAACLATGRPGVAAFSGAYHGLTYGTLALTDRVFFRRPFEAQIGRHVRFVPWPDPVRPPAGGAPGEVAGHALADLARVLAEAAPPIGAVIVEPIQGRGGIRVPPPGFLQEAGRIAREAGALVIHDEVFTGLGRTGAWFRGPAEGAVPDLLCLGKGLGGGAPLSACLGTETALGSFPADRGESIHTHTHMGNPLACAMGVAALDAIERGGLVERSARLGPSLLASLPALPSLLAPRGAGLLAGVECIHPGTLDPWPDLAAETCRRALAQGVILLTAGAAGNVIQISPPLVIDEHDLGEGAAILGGSLREAWEALR